MKAVKAVLNTTSKVEQIINIKKIIEKMGFIPVFSYIYIYMKIIFMDEEN